MREPIAVPLAPPTGMRDLLPPDAAARGALAGTLTATFASYGYQLVTTPPFEHAEVIERGLDTIDRRDLLRFVEPESGEVALLRPDITPQIARIVATRLADRPPPFRLCYAGSLIRQRRGRARTQRQIMQAGVEHLGPSGTPGQADAEVIALAVEAARRTGLTALHLELHLVGLARAAIHELPEAARDAASAALSRKDRVELEAIVRRAGADRAAGRRLARASELYGELSLLEEARRVFPGREARAALDELEAVASKLAGMGVAGGGLELSVDLGEVRGTSYYTGVSFVLLARGPGEPIGAGGRYDTLLSRFGLDLPATGFGLDVGNLEWALEAAGRRFEAPRKPRVVVSGPARERFAASLREAGADVAVLESGDARAYASAWGLDAAAVTSKEAGARAHRLRDGREKIVRSARALLSFLQSGASR